MFRRSFGLGMLVVTGFFAGCAQRSETQNQSVSKPATTTNSDRSIESSSAKESTAAKASVAPEVKLIEADWSEVQKLVADQKGKVVVLDVWSTACEPCMKEFPHLIALQKRFPEDVVAISFDIDYAGIKKKPVTYYRERIVNFLGSQPESTVLHRMSTTAADELFAEIKLDSIPAVYVYGRNGVLAKRFDGSNGQGEGISYEKQVIPFVEERVKDKE